MIASLQKLVVHAWQFVFDHEVSPLRNIPDVAIRHYVLQALGMMWALAFAVATGSYAFMAASLVGHTVLIATMAHWRMSTWTTAAARPGLFLSDATCPHHARGGDRQGD